MSIENDDNTPDHSAGSDASQNAASETTPNVTQPTEAIQPTDAVQPTEAQATQPLPSAETADTSGITEPIAAQTEAARSYAAPSAYSAPAGANPYAAPYATEAPAGQQIPAAFAGPALIGPPRKKRKPLLVIAIATAAVVGIAGGGAAAGALISIPLSALASHASNSTNNASGNTDTNGTNGTNGSDTFGQGTTPGGGTFGGGSSTQDGQGYGSGTTSTVTQATASTEAEKVGVVTINTVLDYNSKEQAAGTGMIISSDGLILTNNHVVEQSTSITVTVESTGKEYKAVVVGTDATKDVAVLQLQDASGLSTVNFDSSGSVAVGDKVYSVGNAEGTGDLVTASGDVGAVDKSLTISSDFSTAGESLDGLIEVNSDVVSGDSGGPLFDKGGDVIGIITAASSGSANITGYAIDISDALAVVKQIESGTETDTVTIGYPAFLGVSIGTTATTKGVPVGSVFAGKPAAKAGITAGSIITSVSGKKVTTAAGLSALVASKEPGDSVIVKWIDAKGASHTSTVTLVEGPAA